MNLQIDLIYLSFNETFNDLAFKIIISFMLIKLVNFSKKNYILLNKIY